MSFRLEFPSVGDSVSCWPWQWGQIAGQAYGLGGRTAQPPTQCDWQGQANAVIIPYYPWPFLNAASHVRRADPSSAFIRLPVSDFHSFF